MNDIRRLADIWLEFKRDELSAATLYTYRRILETRVVPALTGRLIDDLTALDLEEILLGALSERSPNEALKTRAVVRGLFSYASRLGVIAVDPSADIKLPRGTGVKRTGIHNVPSTADARAMASALDKKLSLMPLLAAFAGLRWQEVAALLRTDMEITTRTIKVERALCRIQGVKEPKTQAGSRKTVWAAEITEDIVAHLTRIDSDRLFVSPRGTLLNYSNWRIRHWLPACSDAGLDWTFHDYRHTFAVESLRRGRSVQSVAAMMGHANPRVTWEFYAGLFEDHLEEARQVW